MCSLPNGLLITPGHPVYYRGEWVYPRSIVESQTMACPSFFNLVVDRQHIATINGFNLILLGHNYSEGILQHDYYGSSNILDDLRKAPGYENGYIEL